MYVSAMSSITFSIYGTVSLVFDIKAMPRIGITLLERDSFE
jgi:hypothetical protein